MSQISEKLLVIGHVWPQPNATAAGEHIMHIMQLFINYGCQIHFVTAAQAPLNYNFNILSQKGIHYTSVEINCDSFDDYILKLKPKMVLFDRFMVEEQFSWRIKKHLPNCIHFLDTEDLHFLRKLRQNNFKGKTENEISDIAKRELASIYRSDLSFIISEKEMELLTTKYQVPKAQLFYLPLLTQPVKTENLPSFKERKHVVFVGNFLHEPNWQAVQTLKKDIWPKIHLKNKEIELHIYGSYASQKHLQLHNAKQHFYVHGYVEDIDLIIKNTRLLVAPLYFGAGQKGKLLKAMQNGTPSITTTIGAESMNFTQNWPGTIVTDNETFILATLELYNNEINWNKAQQKINPLLAYFNFDTHAKQFNITLEKLINNITEYRNKNIIGNILWHHSMRSTEYMSRWITEKNKK